MEIVIKLSQFLLSLSLLIILHELGHFIPAKIFKTRVEKFYLFFDVKYSLLKKKIGETEYGIGWLPLGGYVKISGMIDESMDKEQMALPPQPWEFRSKPAWQRLIIMLGGVTVNFILAFIIYIGMTFFYGEQYIANSEAENGIWITNPVIEKIGLKTGDKIIAVDCKMNIDDNALMRHPEIGSLRDLSEEDPTEVEAGQYNLNFVKLDGNVGCMVNGAGLAMATMDMIKLSGGEPANFLDVGGTANAQTVEAGFRIILKDPKVKAILINIFGGIVRCDRVAQGVIDAYNSIGNINIPIIVRLQGTNADVAKKLIDESGLKVQSAIQLSEAAELVNKAVA